jgi:hypothetical protein
MATAIEAGVRAASEEGEPIPLPLEAITEAAAVDLEV